MLIATTTFFTVVLLLLLCALVRRLSILIREYLFPDDPLFQARIVRQEEQLSQRINFYTAVIRRPRSFQDGAAPLR